MTGDWKYIGNNIYIDVNDNGTLERLDKPKWYRVIILFVLNAFGKYKSYSEVKLYLSSGRLK